MRTLTIIAGTLLLSAGCTPPPDPWEGTKKIRVVASFAPIHCFAANIAEPDAEVRCLLTASGPHDYHSSPQDVKLVSSADLFISNGLGLDSFVNKIIQTSGNRKLKTLILGEAIPKERLIESAGHYHGDEFHAGSDDPHIWLGIEEATLCVEAIRDILIELDPDHKAGYEDRTARYIAQLNQLKIEAADLKELPGGLVTFHESFGYLGRSFNIPIAGAIRGVEGQEISPSALQKQVKQFKEKGVRIIGVEPQYPMRAAEMLAESLGKDQVSIIDLDPVETGPRVKDYYIDKEFYVTKMRENLENLKRAASQ